MSNLEATLAGGRPLFASKTTFEALAVDSGEESEQEEQQAESTPSIETKPSKSALKKAAKLARIEKRQQQKASKAASRSTTPSDAPPSPPPSPPISRPTQIPNPEAKSGNTIPLPAPALDEIPTVVPPNGDAPPTLPVSVATSGRSSPDSYAYTGSVNDSRLDLNDPKLEETAPPAPVDGDKGRRNVVERTIWALVMIGGFIALLLAGHAYMIILVMGCQTLVYREVTALFSLRHATAQSNDAEVREGKDPWSKTLNWYFFAVTNYFLYGESIIYYFKHVVFADAQLLPFATNHRIISFMLYTIGFMGFVMSLKKGFLKQQFSLFCWVHMSLLLIVVSSHFIVNNILEGLIWFWVPASLVICNDIFAYIWGKSIGRTPLIKLSPKKTVEGFVGAFWSTMIFGVLWGTYFMRFDYMICPVNELGIGAWSETGMQCTPNPIFVWREWQIWKPVAVFLSTLIGRSITTIPYATYQFHVLLMSCFASLFAPFGGFFASGFKRAFNIKDFGHSIPGHGGMTDRMDCQFLMGVFVYVYHSSLIRENNVTVGSVMQTIVSGLTVDEQIELFKGLKGYLVGQGVNVVALIAGADS